MGMGMGMGMGMSFQIFGYANSWLLLYMHHISPSPSNSRILKQSIDITKLCNPCLVNALLIALAWLDECSMTPLFRVM